MGRLFALLCFICYWIHCLYDFLFSVASVSFWNPSVFFSQFPKFRAYRMYCARQTTAAESLQTYLKENPRLQQLVRLWELNTRTKRLPLSTYLLKPMQRLTKYKLLVDRVCVFLLWFLTFYRQITEFLTYSLAFFLAYLSNTFPASRFVGHQTNTSQTDSCFLFKISGVHFFIFLKRYRLGPILWHRNHGKRRKKKKLCLVHNTF